MSRHNQWLGTVYTRLLATYETLMTPEAGGWAAELPDLGLATWGEDFGRAVAMAYDAMTNACDALLSQGLALPSPTWRRQAPEGGRLLAVCGPVGADVPDDAWMDVADAAGVLGVTPARVRAMARAGVLGARKPGGMWQVATDDVRRS